MKKDNRTTATLLLRTLRDGIFPLHADIFLRCAETPSLSGHPNQWAAADDPTAQNRSHNPASSKLIQLVDDVVNIALAQEHSASGLAQP